MGERPPARRGGRRPRLPGHRRPAHAATCASGATRAPSCSAPATSCGRGTTTTAATRRSATRRRGACSSPRGSPSSTRASPPTPGASRPSIAELTSRTLRRSRHLAVLLAVAAMPRLDARLLAVLWHLADRWGRVGPERHRPAAAPDPRDARRAVRRAAPFGHHRAADARARRRAAPRRAGRLAAARRPARRRRARGGRARPHPPRRGSGARVALTLYGPAAMRRLTLVAVLLVAVAVPAAPASGTVTATRSAKKVARAIVAKPGVLRGARFVKLPPQGNPVGGLDDEAQRLLAPPRRVRRAQHRRRDAARRPERAGRPLDGQRRRARTAARRSTRWSCASTCARRARANCLRFAFKLFSEEYDEFVDTEFNDVVHRRGAPPALAQRPGRLAHEARGRTRCAACRSRVSGTGRRQTAIAPARGDDLRRRHHAACAPAAA